MIQNRRNFLKTLGISWLTALPNVELDYYHNHNVIIKPPRLKKGDTIGLISPASALPEQQEYNEVASDIRDLGFNVKIGHHAEEEYGDLAGIDANRASDLNAMFSDPAVNAIIPFRGGWGCNRILDLIDFEIIKENPKPFIGYSDITSLLLSIYAKTGLVTFHGPVGKSEWNEFTSSHFRQAVMGNRSFLLKNPENLSIRPEFNVIRSGKARGTILGGNLSVLTSMIGSNYLPDWEGSILFVEDVGEKVYRIDRMITQLKLSGILEKINGFIFGRCTKCNRDHKNSLSLEQVLKDHIQPLGIPAFFGSMIGHIEHIFTIPVGIQTEINADNGSIELLEVPTIMD